jgi:hypothetical protein
VPARREQAGPAATSAGRGSGWLTDLLARASRDEEEQLRPAFREQPADPSPVETIELLTAQIGRLMNQDAVADLWTRTQAGERTAFSRRLYTMAGQQSFDELKRRHKRDDGFRQATDRYLAEFERLLDEATQSSGNPALANAYLTSDTGKVYTLLAHVAGRFEG